MQFSLADSMLMISQHNVGAVREASRAPSKAVLNCQFIPGCLKKQLARVVVVQGPVVQGVMWELVVQGVAQG